MSESQCCVNGKVKDPKVCTVMIVVGHSNRQEKNSMTRRLKRECKSSNKYDRVGVACCFQKQTAGEIPPRQQFPNDQRTDQELPKGAPTIAAMEVEIAAAKANLCNSNEKCCSSIIVSFVSVGGAAGEDVQDFQNTHSDYQIEDTGPNRHGVKSQKPVPCVDKEKNEVPRSCKERGGVGS